MKLLSQAQSRRHIPTLAAVCTALGLACAGGSSAPADPPRGAGSGPAAPPRAGSGSGAAGSTPGSIPNAPNAGTGGSGGASGAGGLTPRGCNDLKLNFEPVIPIVLLVVDRSGSMFENAYAQSPTRWQAVYDSLMDQTAGIVKPLENEVRFGLMTYTGNSTARMCPVLDKVAPALGNYTAIEQVYSAAGTAPAFKADTPTGPALREALQLLRDLADDPDAPAGPRFILLITDGEPDTCATPDPSCGQDESIAAVQAAFGEKIGTFVVGISSDVGAAHLQDLANAGVGMPVRYPDMTFLYNCVNPGFAQYTAAYAAAGQPGGTAMMYQPADRDAITANIRQIIRGVAGCSFSLDKKVQPGKEHLGTVLLDGTRLTYEDANGFRLQDDHTIEVLGTACTTLRQSASQLSISFPCDVVDVL